MGYKGVETTEMVLDGHRVAGVDRPRRRRPGGRGFYQMMDGIEVGRVNVAARACGISIRAFELAIAYAQQRQTFGKPIAEHQAIAFKLAEMATKIEAAHAADGQRRPAQGLRRAQRRRGRAWPSCSRREYCAEVTQESFRIHGGYGYSKEYEIERLMREAPFLLIGEGTSARSRRRSSAAACCASTSPAADGGLARESAPGFAADHGRLTWPRPPG